MRLPDECLGASKGPGILLRCAPPGNTEKVSVPEQPKLDSETLARCLSPAIRAHVLAGGGAPEHRPVTIAFIRFEGTDALIAQHGLEHTAEALHRVVSVLEAAAEEQGVAQGSMTEADVKALDQEALSAIAASVAFAEASPFPTPEQALEDMYAA